MEEVYSLSQSKTVETVVKPNTLRHQHGKENVVADALSRVSPLQSNNSKIKESNINVIPRHHITQSAPVRVATV